MTAFAARVLYSTCSQAKRPLAEAHDRLILASFSLHHPSHHSRTVFHPSILSIPFPNFLFPFLFLIFRVDLS